MGYTEVVDYRVNHCWVSMLIELLPAHESKCSCGKNKNKKMNIKMMKYVPMGGPRE